MGWLAVARLCQDGVRIAPGNQESLPFRVRAIPATASTLCLNGSYLRAGHGVLLRSSQVETPVPTQPVTFSPIEAQAGSPDSRQELITPMESVGYKDSEVGGGSAISNCVANRISAQLGVSKRLLRKKPVNDENQSKSEIFTATQSDERTYASRVAGGAHRHPDYCEHCYPQFEYRHALIPVERGGQRSFLANTSSTNPGGG